MFLCVPSGLGSDHELSHNQSLGIAVFNHCTVFNFNWNLLALPVIRLSRVCVDDRCLDPHAEKYEVLSRFHGESREVFVVIRKRLQEMMDGIKLTILCPTKHVMSNSSKYIHSTPISNDLLYRMSTMTKICLRVAGDTSGGRSNRRVRWVGGFAKRRLYLSIGIHKRGKRFVCDLALALDTDFSHGLRRYRGSRLDIRLGNLLQRPAEVRYILP